jgi:hypothetical protein
VDLKTIAKAITMSVLTYIERDFINRLFNNGGYVLDFSTDSFNRFTIDSIGIPLCEKYGMSKGKSLLAFIDESKGHEIAKLVKDLLDYYVVRYGDRGSENEKLITACREIVLRLQGRNVLLKKHSEKLITAFDSDYIAAQIKQMDATIETHPSDAIGKAKELLESCCETILKEKNITCDERPSLPQLVKKVCEELKLTPEHIPNEAKAAKSIKAILGNLSAIAVGIAELRNEYGTGHGKSASYKGLTPRHARLAVGTATTAVLFIWETHEELTRSHF